MSSTLFFLITELLGFSAPLHILLFCLQRCSCRLGCALISKLPLAVSLYDVSLILISELVSMSLLSLHPGIDQT